LEKSVLGELFGNMASLKNVLRSGVMDLLFCANTEF
jgi:hypothetical protein